MKFNFVRHLRNHQNLALVLAGILIVVAAGSCGLYVEARVNGLGTKPEGFDEFLYYKRDRIARVAAGAMVVGIAVSLTGMFRMIRFDS